MLTPLSYYGKWVGGIAVFMDILADHFESDFYLNGMIENWKSLSKSGRRYVCLDELAESYRVDADEVIKKLYFALSAATDC